MNNLYFFRKRKSRICLYILLIIFIVFTVVFSIPNQIVINLQSSDGQPLSNINVEVHYDNSSIELVRIYDLGTTDADGKVVWKYAKTGKYTIVVLPIAEEIQTFKFVVIKIGHHILFPQKTIVLEDK